MGLHHLYPHSLIQGFDERHVHRRGIQHLTCPQRVFQHNAKRGKRDALPVAANRSPQQENAPSGLAFHQRPILLRSGIQPGRVRDRISD
ncbi:MAG: hypothetical protein M0Z84_15675 [Gammaproteobacteria bacterium]|nr:hypothetical protein [Gammaproteobacteria bacterium]